MLWYILPPVVTLVIGYFIGSNNPLPSVKKKLIEKAQQGLGKL
jgi:hypothetical protein